MKILSIAFYDFIKLMRDKTALVFMILLPVLFTSVMGLAFGNMDSSSEEPKIPVGMANLDTGREALALMDEIRKNKTLWVKELDEEQVYKQVKNAEVDVGFIIPGDFSTAVKNGKISEIKVVKLPASTDFMAIEGIIHAAFSKINLIQGTMAYFENKADQSVFGKKEIMFSEINEKLKQNVEKAPLVSVENIKLAGDERTADYDGKTQVSLGFMVMFVTFTVIFGAGEILEEKKINTWSRLNATPTGRSTMILGKIMGTFLTGWFQVAFLVLFGRFVFGISWGNSIHASAILISVYLLSVTGTGMFLASLVQTNAQLGAYSSILIICTSMMSGCWWPVEIQPPVMQKIAAFLPQYWAIKGLTNTVVGNLGLQSIIEPVLVLTVMGTIFFILSVFSGKVKEMAHI